MDISAFKYTEEIHLNCEKFDKKIKELKNASEEQKQNTERLQTKNDKLNKEIAKKEEQKDLLKDEIIKKENQRKSIRANYDRFTNFHKKLNKFERLMRGSSKVKTLSNTDRIHI